MCDNNNSALCKTGTPVNLKTVISEEKRHECCICGYTTAYEVNLQQHYQRHTGQRPLECNLCDFKCRYSGTLRQHIWTHTREIPDDSLKETLQEHKTPYTAHSGICIEAFDTTEIFICITCGKIYATASRLEDHVRRHTEGKPNKCDLCGRADLLKGHNILTHTKEKPYRCNLCDIKTTTASSLKRHKLTEEIKEEISSPSTSSPPSVKIPPSSSKIPPSSEISSPSSSKIPPSSSEILTPPSVKIPSSSSEISPPSVKIPPSSSEISSPSSKISSPSSETSSPSSSKIPPSSSKIFKCKKCYYRTKRYCLFRNHRSVNHYDDFKYNVGGKF